jgi:lipopolysaccharide export system protein LptA
MESPKLRGTATVGHENHKVRGETFTAKCRFGSLAATPSDGSRVRFTPESGHEG